MKVKNIEQAADRIRHAIAQGERILLYGDSDLDGIASVTILQEAIQSAGGKIHDVFFPDRENDGYGLNFKALELVTPLAPALFITLDLGIANIKEIDVANSLGFEVIVVDHHEVLDKVPNAKVVVDPKQPGDSYPFKGLCNAGLTFKLAEELLGDKLSENFTHSLLELVALATISDMVPQEHDNKLFLEKGLKSLTNTYRPALRAFLDILGTGEVAAGGFMRIIAALNAAESINFKNNAYTLLTSSSPATCRELAEELLGKVQFKQQKVQEAAAEVERRISQKRDESIIFEGDPAWRLVFAGPIASIIAQKYEKPTFIFRKGDVESYGSVRSLKEHQNSIDAMKSCADLLTTYGGHAKASGFRLKNENLEKFKQRLIVHFSKK